MGELTKRLTAWKSTSTGVAVGAVVVYIGQSLGCVAPNDWRLWAIGIVAALPGVLARSERDIALGVARKAAQLPQAPMILLALFLAGCATLRGPEGAYEGGFSCKGKGSLTGNGSLSIGAGYGGSGTNAWTIQGDCGDGFEIKRTRDRAGEPAVTK